MSTSLLSAGTPSGALLQALCILPQSLRVHMCFSTLVFRKSHFLSALILSGSYTLSSPLTLTLFLSPLLKDSLSSDGEN